jgi:hypothetical protein
MPSRIVIDSAWIIFFWLPSIRLWWAQVMDTPDARRTDVLRRGTSRGSSGLMPVGGQQPPSSGIGARLEW